MSFTREWTVKAVRKPGRCDGCRKPVLLGEPAMRWVGVTDGEFGSAFYHPECRTAEIALNRLHDTFCQDEWQSICEIESDDHDWLREAYPIVAARFSLLPSPTPAGSRWTLEQGLHHRPLRCEHRRLTGICRFLRLLRLVVLYTGAFGSACVRWGGSSGTTGAVCVGGPF